MSSIQWYLWKIQSYCSKERRLHVHEEWGIFYTAVTVSRKVLAYVDVDKYSVPIQQ